MVTIPILNKTVYFVRAKRYLVRLTHVSAIAASRSHLEAKGLFPAWIRASNVDIARILDIQPDLCAYASQAA